ncbi:MAG: hypothetical protein P1V97_38505 [Planctomycetota bacterium]|nr:hypothetical protein [Planctomycetota bacterium]
MLKRCLIVVTLVFAAQSAHAQDNPKSRPAEKPKADKPKAEKPKPEIAIVFEALSPKNRGIAALKEVLALVHHNKLAEVFDRIADGKRDSYSIPRVSFNKDKWSTPEKAAKFKKKNFPHYDELYQAFDQMRISKECTTKKTKVYWDGVKKIETGTVYTYRIECPSLTKKYPQFFSRLQFLAVDGKIYFIPFGW